MVFKKQDSRFFGKEQPIDRRGGHNLPHICELLHRAIHAAVLLKSESKTMIQL
jgi:hypothetical protein